MGFEDKDGSERRAAYIAMLEEEKREKEEAGKKAAAEKKKRLQLEKRDEIAKRAEWNRERRLKQLRKEKERNEERYWAIRGTKEEKLKLIKENKEELKRIKAEEDKLRAVQYGRPPHLEERGMFLEDTPTRKVLAQLKAEAKLLIDATKAEREAAEAAAAEATADALAERKAAAPPSNDKEYFRELVAEITRLLLKSGPKIWTKEDRDAVLREARSLEEKIREEGGEVNYWRVVKEVDEEIVETLKKAKRKLASDLGNKEKTLEWIKKRDNFDKDIYFIESNMKREEDSYHKRLYEKKMPNDPLTTPPPISDIPRLSPYETMLERMETRDAIRKRAAKNTAKKLEELNEEAYQNRGKLWALKSLPDKIKGEPNVEKAEEMSKQLAAQRRLKAKIRKLIQSSVDTIPELQIEAMGLEDKDAVANFVPRLLKPKLTKAERKAYASNVKLWELTPLGDGWLFIDRDSKAVYYTAVRQGASEFREWGRLNSANRQLQEDVFADPTPFKVGKKRKYLINQKWKGINDKKI